MYFETRDGQSHAPDISLDSVGPVTRGIADRPTSPGVYLGAAGAKSKLVTRTANAAKTKKISTLSNPGGTEAHDVMYGFDGDEDGVKNSMTDGARRNAVRT